MTKLNRDEKGQVVAEVVERLERTETIVTADFRGLTVAELADLRGKLRDAEAEMTVVKNTLSRRAADQTGRSALLPYLEGPTGLVWVNGDPAQAAKALSDFAKAHKEVFTIRGGVLGSEDLPAASIVRLASLPSREQMLGQLAGALASPISGLAGRLTSLIGNMARVLAAVRDSGALAPGEAPPAEISAAEEAAPPVSMESGVAADPPRMETGLSSPVSPTDAPVEGADAQPNDTPAEDGSGTVAETPAEDAPAAEAPAGEAPATEAPGDDGPEADAPAEEAPATEAQTDDDADDTPAPDAPAEDESETPES